MSHDINESNVMKDYEDDEIMQFYFSADVE